MIFDRPTPTLTVPQQAALHRVLTDLSGPAEPGELTLEAAVLATFRSRSFPAVDTTRSPASHASPGRRLAPHSPRLAAGLAAAAIVVGGAAAAYADVLPGPLQNLAHQAFDAPAARHSADRPPGAPAHHPPGARPAGAASPTRVPHSATAGPAHAHRQPGRRAHPSRPAHPAHGRPSAKPSPQPERSSHPVPPEPSRPANAGHPAQRSEPPGQSRPTSSSQAS
jgi:hypothetical protein